MTTRATAGPAGIREGQDLLADITAAIGRVVGSVTEVGAAMTALAAAARAGRNPLRRADLAALRPLVAQVLARHRGFAAGAGVVLAPDALTDAPRCIDWWWADRGTGPGTWRSTSTRGRPSSTTTPPPSGTASPPGPGSHA
jgi:hypothetical protein